jgi:hypothetical protein
MAALKLNITRAFKAKARKGIRFSGSIMSSQKKTRKRKTNFDQVGAPAHGFK